MKKIILIDGTFLACKYFYGIPRIEDKTGQNINALVGFCRFLSNFYQKEKKEDFFLTVAFESPTFNFRKKLYTPYKANRGSFPDDLSKQIILIKEAIRKFSFQTTDYEGFEADDIIASYVEKVKNTNTEVEIYGYDKDLFQLMGKNIKIINPIKLKEITKEEIKKKFGVSPKQMIDFQTIVGDSCDNIKGIKGIGKKTAAKLLTEYGSIEKIITNLDKLPQTISKNIKDNINQITLNTHLTRLVKDIPLKDPINQEKNLYNKEKLKKFLQHYKLERIIKKLTNL